MSTAKILTLLPLVFLIWFGWRRIRPRRIPLSWLDLALWSLVAVLAAIGTWWHWSVAALASAWWQGLISGFTLVTLPVLWLRIRRQPPLE